MASSLFACALLLAAITCPTGSHADTTTVQTSGTTFSPPSVTIQVGDTVKWVRTSLSHTVTSGFGGSDPNVGALFDAPLNGLNQVFHYTFSDTAGTYPYFCRPHELMGMTGTVIVEPQLSGVPSAGCCDQVAAWGRVKSLFR
jgi:plastocyanin